MAAASSRPSAVDIRRADERFHTRIGWLDSHHSFSFSNHYDPANTHHGLLLVSNDDTVRAGTGFRTHPHQDMEIVTWVLEGELEHKDSEGHTGIIYPGLAQRMSAGTGIWHSEMNPRHDRDVHFVQMWVPPDTERIQPGYEQLDINAQLELGGLVPIASGRGHAAAISIRQRGAEVIASDLKDVGLTVNVVPLDVAALIDRLTKGTYDAAYYAVAATDTDPSANLDYWLSSGSFHLWHPKQKTPATPWEAEIDTLIRELTGLTDLRERQMRFARVQQIIATELPTISFAAPSLVTATSTRVDGVEASPIYPYLLWRADTMRLAPPR